MDEDNKMERLYDHASHLAFDDFDTLLAEIEAIHPFEDIVEAYAMRAQIKLFAADPSLLEDLAKVEQMDIRPWFACLNTVWECDMPNRFSVFPREPGMMRAFFDSLPQAQKTLSHLYGKQGDIMVRIIQCNILYFTGKLQDSLSLSEEMMQSGDLGNRDALLHSCNAFRCCMALDMPAMAEQYILKAIRLSKKDPDCVVAYEAFREWVNLTTGWNGDSPRYAEDKYGVKRPNLNDRLESIRSGIARATPVEAPFTSYAERHYKDAYTLRAYYMDIFHAIYWHMAGDSEQTKASFQKFHEVATETGIMMPIIESGGHIVPFLQDVLTLGSSSYDAWCVDLIDKAEQYEVTIDMYRSAGL